MRRTGTALKRLRRDERGSEMAAAIFVLPVLFILLIGIIDVGWMIKTRMVVDNIISTTVKQAGADGGDYNPVAMRPGEAAWSTQAMRTLWDGGNCTQSHCSAAPSVFCDKVTRPNGSVYYSQRVVDAGDVITCTVNYPYSPLSGGLLNTPLGLGIGGLLHGFTITESARSEIGSSGY